MELPQSKLTGAIEWRVLEYQLKIENASIHREVMCHVIHELNRCRMNSLASWAEAAAQLAQTQIERLHLEQKSMILDRALQAGTSS